MAPGVSARRIRAEARKSAMKKESHKNARRKKSLRGMGAIMGGSLRGLGEKTDGAVGLGGSGQRF